MLVLSAIAAVSGFVAQEAGEALEHLTHEPGFDHAAKGDRAFIALLVLFLATLVVIDGLLGPSMAPMNLAGVLPWTWATSSQAGGLCADTAVVGP